MNEDPNNPQNITSNDETPAVKAKKVVIQPSADLIKEVETQKQQTTLNAPIQNQVPASIYLDPVRTSSSSINQQSTKAILEVQNKDNDKPVSFRVKSLLVLAIISMLGAAYELTWTLSIEWQSSLKQVLLVLCVIQMLVAIYLFIGKSRDTVALILKIYLIIDIITAVFSIANPTAFALNFLGILFIYYVYSRVKSLR